MTRILLIEDDEDLLFFLRNALQNAGYEVLTGRDGQEGIRLYRENPTELVISDIVMPGKDGLAVLMELQREFPEVRLIAISGGNEQLTDHVLDIAHKFGAVRTLLKPFSVAELLDTVREVLA